MKRCTYCGKEYADDVSTCPVDGTVLVGLSASEPAPPPFAATVTGRRRIARISIHQTSKVVALLYVAIALFFVPFGIFMLLTGQTDLGIVYLLMPVFYGVIGYPLIALLCWVYNVIARRTGGVEFTVEEERVPPLVG